MWYICCPFKFSGVISITDLARNRVIKLMEDDGFNHTSDFVRVGVKSGGCSGLSYDLKFDNNLKEDDKLFEDNEIKIVVDKKKFIISSWYYFRVFRWIKWQGICIKQPKC